MRHTSCYANQPVWVYTGSTTVVATQVDPQPLNGCKDQVAVHLGAGWHPSPGWVWVPLGLVRTEEQHARVLLTQ